MSDWANPSADPEAQGGGAYQIGMSLLSARGRSQMLAKLLDQEYEGDGYTNEDQKAVVCVQKAFRGMKARAAIREMKDRMALIMRYAQVEEQAAVTIQKGYTVNKQKKQELKIWEMEEGAAIRLQAAERGKLERRKAYELKMAPLKKAQDYVMTNHMAAVIRLRQRELAAHWAVEQLKGTFWVKQGSRYYKKNCFAQDGKFMFGEGMPGPAFTDLVCVEVLSIARVEFFLETNNKKRYYFRGIKSAHAKETMDTWVQTIETYLNPGHSASLAEFIENKRAQQYSAAA